MKQKNWYVPQPFESVVAVLSLLQPWLLKTHKWLRQTQIGCGRQNGYDRLSRPPQPFDLLENRRCYDRYLDD